MSAAVPPRSEGADVTDNKTFLGTEPVGKLLRKLAVPTVIAQLVNMLYNIVDRIYIGHMPGDGSLALTGVGVCLPIIMVISAFAALISSGGAPRASIAMGRGDMETAQKLLEEVKFTVIRGNISEVKTLASGSGTTKGVDADVADKVSEENLDSAVAFAKAFAEKTGAVVAITGAIDIVADGKKAYCVRNGHPMMSSITGTGCQLSAMTAAYVTANPEHPLEAAAAAVCAMGLAGEIAHARLSAQDGNSTYRNYIIDAIYNMTPEQLEEGAKYEVR